MAPIYVFIDQTDELTALRPHSHCCPDEHTYLNLQLNLAAQTGASVKTDAPSLQAL